MIQVAVAQSEERMSGISHTKWISKLDMDMRLRVRVPSATLLQIFCVMKTYRTLLMLLLAATTACSKDSAEPETPGPKPSISMTLDYQSREYELGEVIEATLTITEKNPTADYFLLNTSCNGGKATAIVDGRELQWQAEQQIPYEIVNDEFSSKVLHLKITPQAGATAKQPFNFGIYAISTGGCQYCGNHNECRMYHPDNQFGTAV